MSGKEVSPILNLCRSRFHSQHRMAYTLLAEIHPVLLFTLAILPVSYILYHAFWRIKYHRRTVRLLDKIPHLPGVHWFWGHLHLVRVHIVFTTRVRGKVMFSVCQFTGEGTPVSGPRSLPGGEGVPQSLVPGPSGGTPVSAPRSLLEGGTPGQDRSNTPPPIPHGETAWYASWTFLFCNFKSSQ